MRKYINARVIFEDKIKCADVFAENGKITDIRINETKETDETIDCKGLYLSPGFADIHVHGGGGFSAMGAPEDIVNMARAHALRGTTSILPTTLAAPIARLKKAVSNIEKAIRLSADFNILGAHLEGPFISMKMKGAQSPDNIIAPTKENVTELLDTSGIIKIIGAAPEVENGFLVGEEASKRGVTASIAHSDADYSVIEEAVRHGYSDITHIYSACSGMRKIGIFRQVGVVEAGLSLDAFTTQFIGDLRHLPYGALKLIYKAKGADRAYVISDGLEYSATDMEEGTVITQENGQEVIYEDSVMKLKDRSCLAGSVATSGTMVRNLYKSADIPLIDAVKMASLTPLRVIGYDNVKGKIQIGYDEDIILFNDNIDIKYVCVKGKIIKNIVL